MNKTVILIIAAVAAIGTAVYVVNRNSQSYKIAHSGMKLSHPVKCYACGKISEMTFDEMNADIKAGKTIDVPGQFKRFPCPSCGKVEVSLYDGGKYDQPTK